MTTKQRELPAGWKWVKLGDVVTIAKGRKPAEVSEFEFHGCLRHLLISDLHETGVITFASDPNGVEAFEDDILIAWDGANAGTTNYGLSGLVGSTLAVLKKTQATIYTPFLGNFLKSKFKQLNVDMTAGATIPHIQRNLLMSMAIPFPPLEEQKRIAEILNEAEEIKKLREEADKKTEELIPAIFHEMFGDDSKYKQVPFGNLVDKKNGLVRGPFGGSIKKEIFVESGYLVYEQSHAIKGGYDSSRYFITGEKYMEMERFQVCTDDLIVSCSGTIGRVFIIPPNAPKGVINQALLKIRLNQSVALPHYLMNALKYRVFGQDIRNLTKGTAITNLVAVKKLREELVPLPPLDIQQEFIDRVNSTQKLSAKHKEGATKIEILRSSLLQRAFRGEL
jgi:type I restriction enzyme S subunit|tara:strand:+ start:4322 stop:5500 length:1179 start_codon:yes stop_codon:yes gene_type:complete